MKVLLDIRDDTELRKHIRECIKGEITHIIREDIGDMVLEILGKEKGKITVTKAENMMETEVRRLVNQAVNESPTAGDRKKLDREIKRQIAEILTEKKDFINSVVQQTVEALIDEDITAEIKKQVKATTVAILGKTLTGEK